MGALLRLTARTSCLVPAAGADCFCSRHFDRLVMVRPGRHQAGSSASTSLSTDSFAERQHAARDLAFRYLDLWSSSNRVALASAASFYESSFRFHGRNRTLESVLDEKRGFAERWPDLGFTAIDQAQLMSGATSTDRTVPSGPFLTL